MEGTEVRKIINSLLVIILLTLPWVALSSTIIPTSDFSQEEQANSLSQYTEQTPITVTNNAGFASGGFSGSGTEANPYVLEAVSINATLSAITITGTTAHFIIRDCVFNSNNIGVTIFNVTNGIIEDSDIRGTNTGVSIENSSEITILNCSVQAYNRGILLENTTRTTIERSEVYSANIGVLGNTFENGTIIESTFHHNEEGIRIDNGDVIQIERCTFYANSMGVYLHTNATRVTIFSSNFCWNGIRYSGILNIPDNAWDRGSDNTWTRNHWSDYEGDGAYEISGGAQSTDPFPLLISDINDPHIDGPEDIRYDEGETGNLLNWNATDVYPAYISLHVNGEEQDFIPWFVDSYWYLADGLVIGSHNITILYIDAAGNTASDEVWVSVIISIFGGEGTEYVFYASLASILGVAALLLIVKRMR